MTAERVALGVTLVTCIALMGWNVRLQSQLTRLTVEASQENDAPVRTAGNRRDPVTRSARTKGAGADRKGRGGQREAQPGWADPGDGDRAPGEREADHEPTERDWDAIRTEMETVTIDTIEAYAAQNSWEPALTEEILAIYLDSGEAVGEIWAAMHEGETSHYQARKEMREIRDASAADLIGLIGEQAHETVEEHLWEARRDIWRRTHER